MSVTFCSILVKQDSFQFILACEKKTYVTNNKYIKREKHTSKHSSTLKTLMNCNVVKCTGSLQEQFNP